MPKLYPPKIDNILPAFVKGSGTNVLIKIPYQLTFSVKEDDFQGIAYIIKSGITNERITSGTLEDSKGVFNQETNQYELTIEYPASSFIKGQSYKIQIAYISNNITGYYSNIGVAKCINTPTISVDQFKLKEAIGTFSDSVTNEKVYSYSFNIYDEFNNLITTSGEKIHNTNMDTQENSSSDSWEIPTNLKPDITYTIVYNVTTTNNYKTSSQPQTLKYFELYEPELGNAHLMSENNFDEGYNRIYLIKRAPLETEDNLRICGNFILLRASDKDNYENWENLINFQIYDWSWVQGENNIFEVYKDYLIEQGVTYRYAIQAYSTHEYTYTENGGEQKIGDFIYSTKVLNINGPVYCDFENIFLYDGEKQLKICFDPQIGSFKNTLLESKIDTIGGKYPYFFRNGNVKYKEFSLSGLISALQDKNNQFINDSTFNLIDTSLFGENYQLERDFKLLVLDWLTNGKEKVLKTATEGNYIVRLLNTSLSPNNTLGRLLHTFSSTAYETAEYNLNNLKEKCFIQNPKNFKRVYQEIDLSDIDESLTLEKSSEVKIDQAIIYTAPNTQISYRLKGEDSDRTARTNDYGILDLTNFIKNLGLTQINNTSWSEESKIEYSYMNYVENTDDWYTVTNLEINSGLLISEETDNNGWLSGQGLFTSTLDYLNNSDLLISNFSYVTVAIDTSKNYDINNFPDGYYSINLKPKSLSIRELSTDLYDEDTGEYKEKIFRNLQDFGLGEGLKVKIYCPKKIVTLRNFPDTQVYTYAI